MSWGASLWRAGLAPEPQLTVSAWADRHRVLPRASAEPGPWRTSRVPYLAEVMDSLSPSSPWERVVFMKGAQVGATEAGLNWVGYVIAHAPGMFLLVMPTTEAVRRNTAARIDPLIEASPVLRELVVAPRSRESGNSLFRKSFPGGQLFMTGANSAVGLRSLPARFLMLDELDGFPGDVDGEGDPVALAIQRTVTFRGRRKIFLASTPTLEGSSRIEAAFQESDQRRYFVPCRGCGEASTLEWVDIHWPEGRRQAAFWACPGCGEAHEEAAKGNLLAGGEWRPTAPGDGRTAGFHLSSLYSPWETWGEIALEHKAAGRDPVRLQAWTNLKLGHTWQDQAGEQVEPEPLMARREGWGELLPEGVALVTAGVDVQGDRLELQVVGWGRDEESWSLAYRVIWGDPSGPRVWQDLDAALAETFPHRRAVPDLPIRAACVDTGGNHTQAAYRYCATRFARRVWGVKGKGGAGIPLWPWRASRTKNNVPLFAIGVDAAKDAIMARLRLEEPGPGAMHFPMARDAEFFRQLTAERVVTRFSFGRPIRTWKLKRDGDRNEALDTLVYAQAALHGLIAAGVSLNREAANLAGCQLREPGREAPLPPPRPASVRSSWMTW